MSVFPGALRKNYMIMKCPTFLYTSLFSLEMIAEWVGSGKTWLDLDVTYGKYEKKSLDAVLNYLVLFTLSLTHWILNWFSNFPVCLENSPAFPVWILSWVCKGECVWKLQIHFFAVFSILTCRLSFHVWFCLAFFWAWSIEGCEDWMYSQAPIQLL